MKKCIPLLSLSAFFFFLSTCLNAQGIDSMMEVYANQYPQQKVYVHFDKSVYTPGETIWFKAYIFAGFEPSNLSRNFYAELIDKNGLVLQRKIYPIVEASAAGNFDIPGTANGSLNIRAYTTWMLNFDTAFLFKKEIPVVTADSKIDPVTVASGEATQITFFPEGGDLINGLESMVAFKANNTKGTPVSVNGQVKNSKGEVVATFKAMHDGMGTFNLTPATGEQYTAVVKDEFGKELTATLPAAKGTGVVLHVTAAGDKKVFIVKRSDDAAGQFNTVNIVAHMAQHIVYRAKVPLVDAALNSGAIPTAQLPSGILQITAFNGNWEPIAERIVFVNNDNYRFDARLETQIVSLEKHGKNVYEVAVDDTLLANMSLSITDAAVNYNKKEENIYSGLLLTGDLKGYIHDPAYYFKNTGDTTLNNLDLVMLTHGWRRYNWQSIVKGRKPALKHPTDPPLSLTAKIFGVNPSAPLRPDETMTVILETSDSATQILQVPKTGATEFSLRNFPFYDTLKVFYQFDKDRKLASNVSVLFENGLYKGPRTVRFPVVPPVYVDTVAINRSKYFANQISLFDAGTRVNVLQNVLVKTRVKNPKDELDKKYASGLFAGGDAYTFDFVNDKTNANYYDIFTYLQGRVAGLQINKSGSNVSLLWRGSTTSTFLNEMPVDPQTLSGIPVSDIAYVKVFRPPFFGATGGGSGGAIAIYTRKGGDQPVNPGKGLDRGLVTGYSIMKQFYSPNYSDPQTDISTDLRSTLYWNPFIFTDANQKKVRIEFYNNDVTHAFKVVLEGVNEFGKLIRIEKLVQ